MEAKLKDITKQIPSDQGERRRVRPDNSNVNKDQKPRAQKAVVIAKGADCIGQRAARVGEFVHQIMVVDADDPHNDRADHDTKHGSQRTRRRQERCPRHHKRTPSDCTAKGQRPHR